MLIKYGLIFGVVETRHSTSLHHPRLRAHLREVSPCGEAKGLCTHFLSRAASHLFNRNVQK